MRPVTDASTPTKRTLWYKLTIALSCLIFLFTQSSYATQSSAKDKSSTNDELKSFSFKKNLKLEKGVFLVATKTLDNSPFDKSVIYVTQYSSSGTYGLIVNRRLPMTVNEIVPEAKKSGDENNLFFGGPMHARYLFILTETNEAAGLHPVNHGIYFGAGPAIVPRLEKSDNRHSIRTYAGFSSWGPGQIEQEIKSGNWLVIPANSEQLFNRNPELLWTQLYKNWGGDWI